MALSLLSAVSTWWTGHIGAPAVQSNIVDPVNAAITALNTNTAPAYQYCTDTAGTSIPNNADTTVQSWTTVASGGIGAISGGVRTITTGGLYVIQATITFPSGGTGFKRVQLLVNGSAVDTDTTEASSSHNNGANVAVAMPLSAGDTVSVTAYQNSGSAQALTLGANQNHWSIARVSSL